MTKEEREKAIAHGKEQLEVFGGEHAEFIKLAIEALKQVPCEDAVSREAVHDGMIKYGFHSSDMTITEFVKDVLPPVTPTHKKGKWVKFGQSFVNPNKFLCYSCSECGFGEGRVKTKFCPNCGVEMWREDK
jgi:hypothetical protein